MSYTRESERNIPATLTWDQQRAIVDCAFDGYPFDVAVAKVLNLRISSLGDARMFALGEAALEEAERRGYVREVAPAERAGKGET